MKIISFVCFCLLAAMVAVSFSFAEIGGKDENSSSGGRLSVSGKVMSPLGLIGPVRLTLTGPADSSIMTGTDGSFSFTGLTSGTYTLTPERSGYGFLPQQRSVAISGKSISSQDFKALRKLFIAGKVTAPDGSPIYGVEVILLDKANSETLTDTDGSYAFELLKNETYTIVPRKAGMRFLPSKTSVTIDGDNRSGVDFISAQ